MRPAPLEGLSAAAAPGFLRTRWRLEVLALACARRDKLEAGTESTAGRIRSAPSARSRLLGLDLDLDLDLVRSRFSTTAMTWSSACAAPPSSALPWRARLAEETKSSS